MALRPVLLQLAGGGQAVHRASDETVYTPGHGEVHRHVVFDTNSKWFFLNFGKDVIH